MTKKVGLILIITFTTALFPLIYFGWEEMYLPIFIFMTISCSLLIPFGFSLLVINSKSRKVKRIYLGISLGLVAMGFCSKFMQWPGASAELVIGILWFCFAYSPIELKHK